MVQLFSYICKIIRSKVRIFVKIWHKICTIQKTNCIFGPPVNGFLATRARLFPAEITFALLCKPTYFVKKPDLYKRNRIFLPKYLCI